MFIYLNIYKLEEIMKLKLYVSSKNTMQFLSLKFITIFVININKKQIIYVSICKIIFSFNIKSLNSFKFVKINKCHKKY